MEKVSISIPTMNVSEGSNSVIRVLRVCSQVKESCYLFDLQLLCLVEQNRQSKI